MKSETYRDRTILTILLYLLSLSLSTYFYAQNVTKFALVIIPTLALLSRKILIKESGLSNKERAILAVFVIVVACVFMFLSYSFIA